MAVEELVDKLVEHPLAAVRKRALESLFSKLEHGLVKPRELQKATTFKKLLGRVEKGVDVRPMLELLAILSKDCGGSLLVDLGVENIVQGIRSELSKEDSAFADTLVEDILSLKENKVVRGEKRAQFSESPSMPAITLPRARPLPRSEAANLSPDLSHAEEEDKVIGPRIVAVMLGAEDSQRLFDVGARLQWSSDADSVLRGVRELQACIIDIPVAGILEHGSIMSSCLALLSGHEGSEETMALVSSAVVSCLLAIVESLYYAAEAAGDRALYIMENPENIRVAQNLAGVFGNYSTALKASIPSGAGKTIPLIGVLDFLLMNTLPLLADGKMHPNLFQLVQKLIVMIQSVFVDIKDQSSVNDYRFRYLTVLGEGFEYLQDLSPDSLASTSYYNLLDVAQQIGNFGSLWDNSAVFPDSVLKAFIGFIMDEFATAVLPELAYSIRKVILRHCPESSKTLRKIESTNHSLRALQELESLPSSAYLTHTADIVGLVRDAVHALDLTAENETSRCVTLLRNVFEYTRKATDVQAIDGVSKIIMRLMRHRSTRVQCEVMGALCEGLETAQNETEAWKKIITSHEVMESLVKYNLQRADTCQGAALLLKLILQKFGLADCLVLVLFEPWIQCACYSECVDVISVAGFALELMYMSETPAADLLFAIGTLRKLFSRDNKQRREAALQMKEILSLHANVDAWCGMDGLSQEILACGDVVLHPPNRENIIGSFSPGDVKNLFDIVKSGGLEDGIRISAMVQLNTVFGDQKLVYLLRVEEFLTTALNFFIEFEHNVEAASAALRVLAVATFVEREVRAWFLSPEPEKGLLRVFHIIPAIFSRFAEMSTAAACVVALTSFPFDIKTAIDANFCKYFFFPFSVDAIDTEQGAVESEVGIRRLKEAIARSRLLSTGTLAEVLDLLNAGNVECGLSMENMIHGTTLIRKFHGPIVAFDMLDAIATAKSHVECIASIEELKLVIVSNQNVASHVASTSWTESLKRYLMTPPRGVADERLWVYLLELVEVLVETGMCSSESLVYVSLMLKERGFPILDSENHGKTKVCPFLKRKYVDRDLMSELHLRILGVMESLLRQWLDSTDKNVNFACDLFSESSTINTLLRIQDPGESVSYPCRVVSCRCLSILVKLCQRVQADALPRNAIASIMSGMINSLSLCMKTTEYRSFKMAPSADFSEKGWIREQLMVVQYLVFEIPLSLWQTAWLDKNCNFWLLRLTRDREAIVRSAALRILSRLLSCEWEKDKLIRNRLLEIWPEAKEILVCTFCNRSECDDVRAVALQGIREIAEFELTAETESKDDLQDTELSKPFECSMLRLLRSSLSNQYDKGTLHDHIFSMLNECAINSNLSGSLAALLIDFHRFGLVDDMSIGSARNITDLLLYFIQKSSLSQPRLQTVQGARVPALWSRYKVQIDCCMSVGSAALAIEYITRHNVDFRCRTCEVDFLHPLVLSFCDGAAALLDFETAHPVLGFSVAEMVSKIATCINCIVNLNTESFVNSILVQEELFGVLFRALSHAIGSSDSRLKSMRVSCCRLMASLLSCPRLGNIVDDLDSKDEEGCISELLTCIMACYLEVHESLDCPDGEVQQSRVRAIALDRATVGAAMKHLLAWSAQAKSHFVDSDIFVSILNATREATTLTIANEAFGSMKEKCRQTREGRSFRRKLWLQEISQALSILKHLMIQSSPSRRALGEAGFVDLIDTIWPLALINEASMHELLGALSNFLCDNAHGASAVSESEKGQSVLSLINGLVLKPGVSSQTFSLCLSCFQQLSTHSSSLLPVLQTSFVGGQISRIFAASVKVHDLTKQRAIMRLMGTLAAVKGGRRHLLRDLAVRPTVEIVHSLMMKSKKELQMDAILVLHNLSFSTEGKSHFVTDLRYLEGFLTIVKEHHTLDLVHSTQLCFVALSSIKALITKGEKVKVALKAMGVFEVLATTLKYYAATKSELSPKTCEVKRLCEGIVEALSI